VYAEMMEQHRDRLREDQLLIVQAKVTNDEYSGGMRVVAEHIFDLQLAREARAKALRIRLNSHADAAMLKRVLKPFRSAPDQGMPGIPVEIQYVTGSASCTIRLNESWRVRLSDHLVEQLVGWTSAGDVEVAY
jgi:DNA polymerase-3 subunit alpha